MALWTVAGRRLTRRHEELTRSYSGRRREPGQASMRSRRMITPAIVCIAALSAAMPAAAPASSLLSGYGGPGQGSQAILGSSLVNRPPGGGGSPPSGGSAHTGESATAAQGSLGTGAGTPTGSSAHGHPAKLGRAGKRASGGVRGASSGGSPAHTASARDAAVRTSAEGSDTLGVSGMDLLYILAALCALLLTGVLTKRIARTSTPARGAGS